MQNARIISIPAAVLNRFLALLLFAFASIPGYAAPAPASIRVVLDDKYPPCIFRNSSGEPQGILKDLWELWQQRTGIAADFQPMDWGYALLAIVLAIIALLGWSWTLHRRVSARTAELELANGASRESEARYRALAELSSDWYWEQDETLRFTRMSMPDVGRSGIELDTFLGHTRRDAPGIVWDEPELTELEALTAARQAFRDFEIGRAYRNGPTHYVRMSGEPLFDASGAFKGYRGSATDVTRRRHAERALVHERALFEAIFNGIADAIVYAGIDRRVLAINPGFTSIFGYTLEDLAGKETAFIYASREEYERQGRLRFNLNSTQQALPYEVSYRAKNGRLFPGETIGTVIRSASGEVLGYIGVIRDITERKRGERLLRLEHAISRCLANAVDTSFALKQVMQTVCEAKSWGRGTYWRVDEAADVLRFGEFWNVPQYELQRYTEGSRDVTFARGAGLVGRVWQSGNAIWVADFGTDPRVVQKTLAHETGMRGALAFPVVSNNQVLGVLAFLSREVREPDERLLALTQVIGSELGQFLLRKRAEGQVLKLNADLEQRVTERTHALEVANKELEAFSYSVSHDLRAPLRAIQGFSSLVEKQYASQIDEQGQDMLRRVGAGALKMGLLIDDLLKLSQISRQTMQIRLIDLSALAWEVAGELQVEAPERKVEWVISARISANGDPGLLRVVLHNLMGNAWKYSSKRADARIEFGVFERNGKPAYFVRDNGAGFDAAYADKLFGAFQRLHSPGEFSGTGIGLATVKRIVHRHGGEVGAQSKVGEGATFYFTL